MKKIIMFIILLLGLGGAGAGYYLFYYQPQQAGQQVKTDDTDQSAGKSSAADAGEHSAVSKPDVMDYYVDLPKLGIREAPSEEVYVERFLYRGDKVHLYEKKAGWGRITQYFTYQEGGPEVAEWIPLSGLVEQPPVITPQERKKTVLGYIEKSDDLLQFETVFVQKTDELLKDGTCTPEDFEELGGWVRSVKYQERDVYFVYCGGMKQANKIYLNVQTGEIFYR